MKCASEGCATSNERKSCKTGSIRIEVPACVDGTPTREIAPNAYAGNTTVKEIILPEGLERIGDRAFEGCTELREIVLPSTLKTIGDSAFEGCSRLWEAILPEGLRCIGSSAFRGCMRMDSPRIPKTVERIGDRAFGGCLSIRSFIVDGCSKSFSCIGPALIKTDGSTLVCWGAGDQSDRIGLPEFIESIRPGAFEGCSVKSIVLPESLMRADADSFSGCRSLESVELFWSSPCFSTDKGILYTKGMGELLFCPPSIALLEIHMTEAVRSIASRAFEGCDNIRLLDFPQGLRIIGDDAFTGMDRLMVLCIPPGMKASLPYELYDYDETPLSKEESCGKEYLLKNGRFVVNREYEDDADSDEERNDSHADLLKECNTLINNLIDMPESEETVFRPIQGVTTTLKDVAGNSDMKAEIMDRLVLPTLHPEIFKKYNIPTRTGIVMYGPPGTGKTLIARAIAGELDAAFYSVKASDILGKYVGDDEKRIRDLFESARSHDRAVVFFDDFDSIGSSRGSSQEPWRDSLVNELLTQMDGLETSSGCLLVIAATNRPWNLDSALTRPGRFDRMIEVPLPDREARAEIFKLNLSQVPHKGRISYADLADSTKGYSGADIAEACRKAKILRARIESEGGTEGLTMKDVRDALKRTNPSVSEADLKKIKEFAETGRVLEGAYAPTRIQDLSGYR